MFRLPGSSKEPNYNLQEPNYSRVTLGGSRKEWKFRSDKHLRLCANPIYMHYDHELDGTNILEPPNLTFHQPFALDGSQ